MSELNELSKMSVEQIVYEFRLPIVPVWEKAAVDELARRLRAAEADRDEWQETGKKWANELAAMIIDRDEWKRRADGQIAADKINLLEVCESEHTNPEFAGWYYHGDIDGQDEALAWLVDRGIYEKHPDPECSLYRRVPQQPTGGEVADGRDPDGLAQSRAAAPDRPSKAWGFFASQEDTPVYIIAKGVPLGTDFDPSIPTTTQHLQQPTGGRWRVGDLSKTLFVDDGRRAYPVCPEVADWVSRLLAERDELARRLREAEAVIAKLPVTADGVRVTPDMSVWHHSQDEPEELRAIHVTSSGWFKVGPRFEGQELMVPENSDDEGAPLYYSTQEAARTQQRDD